MNQNAETSSITEFFFLYKDDQYLRSRLMANYKKQNKRKLQNMQKEKGSLLAMAVHDMNNYLTGIWGITDILKSELKKEKYNEYRLLNYINIINMSCSQISQINQDLVQSTELISRYGQLKKEKACINSIINKVCKIMSNRAQNKGIDIKIDLPEDPVHGFVNEYFFFRMLGNLIINAIKFSFRNSDVSIKLQSRKKQYLILIQDSGIGIPDEMQKNIFYLSNSVKRPGTENERSSGLGLYIVKQIVDFHQGKIWFETKVKRGTVFYIQMPKILF